MSTGKITGLVFNRDSGTLTLGGDVDGPVTNHGTMILGDGDSGGANAASVRRIGILDNGGTWIFGDETAARTTTGTDSGRVAFVRLEIAGGLSASAGSSVFRMDVDMSGPVAEGDRIAIAGNAAGQHRLTLAHTGNSDVSRRTTFDIVLAEGTRSPSADFSGGVDAGPWHFDTRESAVGWTLVFTGLSPLGNAILDTAGAASLGWFAQLDSLLKRMGDLRLDGPATASATATDTAAASGVAEAREGRDGSRAGGRDANHERDMDLWIRGYAGKTKADGFGKTGNGGAGGVGGSASGFSEYIGGFDIGADRALRAEPGRLLVAGVFGGYFHASRDLRGGDGGTDALYAGVYGTWLREDGWFADAVARVGYFDNDYTVTGRAGGGGGGGGVRDGADYSTWSAGLSLEAGRKVALGSGGWFVEPGAQVAWAHTWGKDYVTDRQLRVETGDADVVQFAGNLRIGRTIRAASATTRTRAWEPYLRLGVVEQISAGGRVRFSGENFRPDTDGLRGVIGAGVIFPAGKSGQLHADIETVRGDNYTQPCRLNVGYRLVF
ncbi:MAG: autotransporter outer membrane beta-barrel domain-containing protein [Opitutaceae bacterium]|nr:autotransporter outer membrane beta-barrel domain-containing protein [Opitutaceae bacterium]